MGKLVWLVLFVFVVGCGPAMHTSRESDSSSGLETNPPPAEPPTNDDSTDPDEPSNPPPVTDPQTPGEPQQPNDPGEPDPPVEEKPLEICSKLSFDNVVWSESLSFEERNAFALALNISGSFEGSAGWSNLTNNFDGQGMSFGLLNQTLGTGSLQPLLHKFSIQHPDLGRSIFGDSQWNKLLNMLANWSSGLVATQFLMQPLVVQEKSFVGSQVDQDKYYAVPEGGLFQMDTRTQQSVKWALDNLYVDAAGKNFKSSWKNAMKTLGDRPEYISLQVEAAERLHFQALRDHQRLNFDELRAYLFLFDIVVQNGGLRASHINEYMNYLERNPNDSKTDQLLNLMEIRVQSSLPQWREDVRKRKRTVILGTGVVHGSRRDLPNEYCYSSTSPF